jgi:hypothetical protein
MWTQDIAFATLIATPIQSHMTARPEKKSATGGGKK